MTIVTLVGAIVLILVIVLLMPKSKGSASPSEAGTASDADVLSLLQAGNKIEAIKCYREIHGVGLKEAKDAVERLEAAAKGQAPS